MIAENLKQVLSELPEKVRLVAVSKFHPNEKKRIVPASVCSEKVRCRK